MLILEIAVAILPFALAAAELVRDWRFRDRRTRRHHQITRAILIAWCLASVGAPLLIWKKTTEAESLQEQIEDLVSGKNEILRQNEKLLHQNTRFQEELAEERLRVQELEVQARRSARGLTDTYDFKGMRRSTRPGEMSALAGDQYFAYQQMERMAQQDNWSSLLEICSREIEATPSWLTPYFFAGIAHASLGNRAEAVRLLRYVQREAAGDPEYSRAGEFLRELGEP